MKKIYLILVAMVLLLTSCDDNLWFVTDVPYNGKYDTGMLVISGELEPNQQMIVYVNESSFFMDTTAYSYDSVRVISNGEEYLYTQYTLRKGYIHNAKVTATINGGAPIQLVEKELCDTITSAYNSSNKNIRYLYGYSGDVVLLPGDKVEISVVAPGYKETAHVSQTIPVKPNAQVTDFAPLTSSNTSEDDDYWVETSPLANVRVHLPAYKGNKSDYLCIRSTTYYHHVYYSENTEDDSFYEWWLNYDAIYSQNPCFMTCGQTNQTLSQGYYGASSRGLYLPANQEDLTLDMVVKFYPLRCKTDTTYGDAYYVEWEATDSVVLEVSSVTEDEYMLVSSMIAGNYYDLDVDDYWDTDDEGYFNFVEIIQDAFDELGSLEGVQLYGNVSGAIGHVTASAHERHCVYREEKTINH